MCVAARNAKECCSYAGSGYLNWINIGTCFDRFCTQLVRNVFVLCRLNEKIFNYRIYSGASGHYRAFSKSNIPYLCFVNAWVICRKM